MLRLCSKIVILCLFNLLGALINLSVCAGKNDSQEDKLIIIGSVLAQDLKAAISFPCVDPVWIVRIITRIAGNEEARHIKVQYKKSVADKQMPNLGDGTKKWKFTLIRDTRCDARMQLTETIELAGKASDPPIKRLQPTAGTDINELPEEIFLPCYILQKDGWAPIKETH